MNTGRGWRFWLGVLLSIASLTWLVVTTDWAQTWQALASANYALVAAAVLLNLLTIPMRTRRWQLLFAPPAPGMGPLTSAMLIGQAVNVIAPARLGDLVRASLVREQPTAYVLGTQVMQTAFDLLMTAVLVVFLLVQVTLPDSWRSSGEALLGTAVVALLALLALVILRKQVIGWLHQLAKRWPQLNRLRLLEIGLQFLRSLDQVNQSSTLIKAVIWSVLIWGVYGLTNHVLLAAFVPGVPLVTAYFLLVVLQLSIAVPSSPGRIGVYHYVGVQALALFGIEGAAAVSFAILLHLISVILPVLIGAILAWRAGMHLRAPATIIE